MRERGVAGLDAGRSPRRRSRRGRSAGTSRRGRPPPAAARPATTATIWPMPRSAARGRSRRRCRTSRHVGRAEHAARRARPTRGCRSASTRRPISCTCSAVRSVVVCRRTRGGVALRLRPATKRKPDPVVRPARPAAARRGRHAGQPPQRRAHLLADDLARLRRGRPARRRRPAGRGAARRRRRAGRPRWPASWSSACSTPTAGRAPPVGGGRAVAVGQRVEHRPAAPAAGAGSRSTAAASGSDALGTAWNSSACGLT